MSASTRTSSTTRHRNRERPAPEHRGRGVGRVHSRTVLLDRAALAQSAERLTRNEKVVGSIPTGGSTSWMRVELQDVVQSRCANSERSGEHGLFRQAGEQVAKHGDQFVRVVQARVPEDRWRQVTTRSVAEAITHTDRTGKRRRTLADAM